jgi:hypothetical protein
MEGCGKIPARPYFTHLSIADAHDYMKNIQGTKDAKLEVNGTLYVCKSCGTPNVGVTRFVNPNTNEVREDFHGTDLQWCFGHCTNETTLVDYLDYVSKIP